MSDFSDTIDEILCDTICNGDGRPTAKHLLIELEHRGLVIRRNRQICCAANAALRKLTLMARTSGGTAGPDQSLMDACAEAETALTGNSGAAAQRQLDRYGVALMMIREGCADPASLARSTLADFGK